MFANLVHRRDFADTCALEPSALPHALAFLQGRLRPNPAVADDATDAAEQFAQASAADSHLLRLVACAAGATLMLALVASF